MDAIDELIESRRSHGVSAATLNAYQFHKANPHVLDFLVRELDDLKNNGWKRGSVESLWNYARWVLTKKQRVPGESFAMSNNHCTAYSRWIVILHPRFNGFFEMGKSKVDVDFGTRLESNAPKPGQLRKLQWADGTPIEHGWRPTARHDPKPAARRERVRRAS